MSERMEQAPGDPPGLSLEHTLQGHGSQVNQVHWSPDGNKLASCSSLGSILIWDAHSGKLRRAFGGNGAVFDVAWSPDGMLLASDARDRSIRLWDVRLGRLSSILPGHELDACCLAFSPDSLTLATGGFDKKIKLWHPRKADALRTLDGCQGRVTSLAWHPYGAPLVSASADGSLRVWDPDSGGMIREIKGHRGFPMKVIWSKDGATVLSAGSHGKVRIWDPLTGVQIGAIDAHGKRLTAIGLSHDQRFLAVKSMDQTVSLIRCDTWERLVRFKDPAETLWMAGLDFHPNRLLLATTGENGLDIRIWKLDPERLFEPPREDDPAMVEAAIEE